MKTLHPIIFLVAFNSAFCQSHQNITYDEYELIKSREYFSTFTIGVIELLSLSIGYQINDSFSVSVKTQNIVTAIGLGLTTGWGIGLTGAYYYGDELFNSIKLSVIPLFILSDKPNDNYFIKAISYECTMSHEKLMADSFRLYYEIGAAICTLKRREALIAPSLKIGVLYNF